MGLILICWAFMALLVVWGLAVVHWDVIVQALPYVGGILAVFVLMRVAVSAANRPLPRHPHPILVEPQTASAWAWDRTYETEDGTVVQELGDMESTRIPSDLADEVVRIRLELAQARAVAEALQGAAVARIRGRAHSWRGASLHLAVEDGTTWQRVIVRVPDQDDRMAISEGMVVQLVARYSGGRLMLERVLEAEPCEMPLPELPEASAKASGVPDWFGGKNEPRDLLKASDGSSSVSDLKVHLVWATKRRKAVLTAAMVERLKALTAEVVEAKNLGRLLAANAEADHVHVALHLPVTVSGSDALGLIKAYTSRFLRREFPALRDLDDESLWQRGGFVGSIGNGGDLSTVLAYIENQSAPTA